MLISGITNGCIYAIVAIGFSIIYNSTQAINFAQGDFVMIGAMVAAVLLAKVSLVVAFPVAILAGCAAGALVALCVLVSHKRSSVVSLIIITVGASILLRGLAQLFFGEAALPVPPFTGETASQDHSFHICGAVIRAQQLWVIGITALLVIGMHLFFKYTLIGKAMRACATNPVGARLVGINVQKMVVLSFVMASALGAVAGVVVSPVFYAKFSMGTALGLKGFCATVLGGLGNFGGAVVAGIVLGVVESLVGGLLWSDYREAVAYVILVVILLFRPQGLLVRRKAKV